MKLQGRNAIYSWVESTASRATKVVIVSPFFTFNNKIESLLISVPRLQVIVGDEFSTIDPDPLKVLSERASCDVNCIYRAKFGRTLHAKVFYAESSGRRQAMLGSANFTVRGLTDNEEQAVSFDSLCESDRPILDELELWMHELQQSATEIDWARAKRQYEQSPNPCDRADGFDTYLRSSAQNFWILKTTEGSKGDSHWSDFVEENVISIGWDDIVRIISDEEGLEPNEYTRADLYAAAVRWTGEANRLSNPNHAAKMLDWFASEFSIGDRIIVCRGYASRQRADVHLYGLAIVDGDAFDDATSDWWRLKRRAVLEPMQMDIPKDAFVNTLGKGSLLHTVHRISEHSYQRFLRRIREF